MASFDLLSGVRVVLAVVIGLLVPPAIRAVTQDPILIPAIEVVGAAVD